MALAAVSFLVLLHSLSGAPLGNGTQSVNGVVNGVNRTALMSDVNGRNATTLTNDVGKRENVTLLLTDNSLDVAGELPTTTPSPMETRISEALGQLQRSNSHMETIDTQVRVISNRVLRHWTIFKDLYTEIGTMMRDDNPKLHPREATTVQSEAKNWVLHSLENDDLNNSTELVSQEVDPQVASNGPSVKVAAVGSLTRPGGYGGPAVAAERWNRAESPNEAPHHMFEPLMVDDMDSFESQSVEAPGDSNEQATSFELHDSEELQMMGQGVGQQSTGNQGNPYNVHPDVQSHVSNQDYQQSNNQRSGSHGNLQINNGRINYGHRPRTNRFAGYYHGNSRWNAGRRFGPRMSPFGVLNRGTHGGNGLKVHTGQTANMENGQRANMQSGQTANMQSGQTANMQSGQTANMQSGQTANMQSGQTANMQSGQTANMQSGYSTQIGNLYGRYRGQRGRYQQSGYTDHRGSIHTTAGPASEVNMGSKRGVLISPSGGPLDGNQGSSSGSAWQSGAAGTAGDMDVGLQNHPEVAGISDHRGQVATGGGNMGISEHPGGGTGRNAAGHSVGDPHNNPGYVGQGQGGVGAAFWGQDSYGPQGLYGYGPMHRGQENEYEFEQEFENEFEEGDYFPQGGYPYGGGYNPQGGYPYGSGYNPQGDYPYGGGYNLQGGYPYGVGYNLQDGYPYGGGNNPQGGSPYGGGNNPQGGSPHGGANNPQGGSPYGVSYNPLGGYPYGVGYSQHFGQGSMYPGAGLGNPWLGGNPSAGVGGGVGGGFVGRGNTGAGREQTLAGSAGETTGRTGDAVGYPGLGNEQTTQPGGAGGTLNLGGTNTATGTQVPNQNPWGQGNTQAQGQGQGVFWPPMYNYGFHNPWGNDYEPFEYENENENEMLGRYPYWLHSNPSAGNTGYPWQPNPSNQAGHPQMRSPAAQGWGWGRGGWQPWHRGGWMPWYLGQYGPGWGFNPSHAGTHSGTTGNVPTPGGNLGVGNGGMPLNNMGGFMGHRWTGFNFGYPGYPGNRGGIPSNTELGGNAGQAGGHLGSTGGSAGHGSGGNPGTVTSTGGTGVPGGQTGAGAGLTGGLGGGGGGGGGGGAVGGGSNIPGGTAGQLSHWGPYGPYNPWNYGYENEFEPPEFEPEEGGFFPGMFPNRFYNQGIGLASALPGSGIQGNQGNQGSRGAGGSGPTGQQPGSTGGMPGWLPWLQRHPSMFPGGWRSGWYPGLGWFPWQGFGPGQGGTGSSPTTDTPTPGSTTTREGSQNAHGQTVTRNRNNTIDRMTTATNATHGETLRARNATANGVFDQMFPFNDTHGFEPEVQYTVNQTMNKGEIEFESAGKKVGEINETGSQRHDENVIPGETPFERLVEGVANASSPGIQGGTKDRPLGNSMDIIASPDAGNVDGGNPLVEGPALGDSADKPSDHPPGVAGEEQGGSVLQENIPEVTEDVAGKSPGQGPMMGTYYRVPDEKSRDNIYKKHMGKDKSRQRKSIPRGYVSPGEDRVKDSQGKITPDDVDMFRQAKEYDGRLRKDVSETEAATTTSKKQGGHNVDTRRISKRPKREVAFKIPGNVLRDNSQTAPKEATLKTLVSNGESLPSSVSNEEVASLHPSKMSVGARTDIPELAGLGVDDAEITSGEWDSNAAGGPRYRRSREYASVDSLSSGVDDLDSWGQRSSHSFDQSLPFSSSSSDSRMGGYDSEEKYLYSMQDIKLEMKFIRRKLQHLMKFIFKRKGQHKNTNIFGNRKITDLLKTFASKLYRWK